MESWFSLSLLPFRDHLLGTSPCAVNSKSYETKRLSGNGLNYKESVQSNFFWYHVDICKINDWAMVSEITSCDVINCFLNLVFIMTSS